MLAARGRTVSTAGSAAWKGPDGCTRPPWRPGAGAGWRRGDERDLGGRREAGLMRLGLLPALGGGIRELAQSGQVARLIDGYFRRYVDAFDEITYFSYLDESIDEYTQDATIRARVRVISPASSVSRGDWARRMVKEAGEALRRCDVLRAFQITGITPLRWSAFWGRRLDVP